MAEELKALEREERGTGMKKDTVDPFQLLFYCMLWENLTGEGGGGGVCSGMLLIVNTTICVKQRKPGSNA